MNESRPANPTNSRANTAIPDWQPLVDIIERADRFELTADLPGVQPNDIDVSLDGNVLSLRGHRSSASSARKRHVGERLTGQFCRKFTLPVTVDGERIAATAAHGTLHLTIPKQPQTTPRRIEIAAV